LAELAKKYASDIKPYIEEWKRELQEQKERDREALKTIPF
jgi:hypothetical protein